jgi:hypothetical protein
LPVFIFLSCDYLRLFSYGIISSFAIFLIVSEKTLENLFPHKFVQVVCRMNTGFNALIPPTKTIIVILALLIGICPTNDYFFISKAFMTSMLGQILALLSEPLRLVLGI